MVRRGRQGQASCEAGPALQRRSAPFTVPSLCFACSVAVWRSSRSVSRRGDGAVGAQTLPPPPLSAVLARAADYVEAFADTVSGLVTAESYVQDVVPAINRFGPRPGMCAPTPALCIAS